MGIVFHKTTTFTSFEDKIADLHAFAIECMKEVGEEYGEEGLSDLVTDIRGSMNGYCSFAILPSGSKEGWEMQQLFDERLETIINRAIYEYDFPVDTVTTSFGGDRVDLGLPYAETE